MSVNQTNKLKIFNDPVYGFILIPDESIFDLIEHAWFQRLRYIGQLGMTHLVYPGARHSRFHHAMGAMYLCAQALEVLRAKGHSISAQESQAVLQAVLLHDIGHGPFSHALEDHLLPGISHEFISLQFMRALNKSTGIPLEEAMGIFTGSYPRKFLHQLVCSQLDTDRLDYLNRDSFYTGVSEGVVSWDRIIKMLNISDEQLVIDEKGIYSIEKFLIARRLMYWQVYMHKTVLAAEKMLGLIMKRARLLASDSADLPCSKGLLFFLSHEISAAELESRPELLKLFSSLDDNDIMSALKTWQHHPDIILAQLCRRLVNRRLFRMHLQKQPIETALIDQLRTEIAKTFALSDDDSHFLMAHGISLNSTYDPSLDNIWIMDRTGKLSDIAQASDQLNIKSLSEPVKKYFLCYPKDISFSIY